MRRNARLGCVKPFFRIVKGEEEKGKEEAPRLTEGG
jgi:hypothetical protein